MCAIFSMCDCNYANVRRQQRVIIAEKMLVMVIIDISCKKRNHNKGYYNSLQIEGYLFYNMR